jgi:uncharacterized membrane protein YfcA
VRQLLLASLAGIPSGLTLLKAAPESLVQAVLGLLLISFGLYNLVAPKLPTIQCRELAYVAGYLAGVLGGAYNTPGPPIIIYGTLCRWPPERFRATLQGYFLSSLLIAFGHGLAGLWTSDVLELYGYALPIVMFATFLGGRLNKSLPRGQFDRFVYVAVVVMGALLLA